MGFYDDEKTANQYIEMAEGYDGRELVEALEKHLAAGATVLELGMGPGVDLKLLEQHYKVTGSDNSAYFLDRFRTSHPSADLLLLDAVTLDTGRTFDCIYSNKVLHHLTEEDLARSVQRQRSLLTDNGLILHSFWRGAGVEEHHGLKFVYQTEESLRSLFGEVFNLVDIVRYSEMEADDSLYILATAA